MKSVPKKKFPKKLFFLKNFFFFVFVLKKSDKKGFGVRTTIWGMSGFLSLSWAFFTRFRFCVISRCHTQSTAIFFESWPPSKKNPKTDFFFSKTKMFFMFEICREKLFWVPRSCLVVFFLLLDEAMCLAYFGISKSLKNIKNPKIVKNAQDRMCRSQKTSNSGPNTKNIFFWLI